MGMDYRLLKHKDVTAAVIRFEDGIPQKYETIYQEEEIPLGTHSEYAEVEKLLLRKWFESRTIPSGRPMTDHILEQWGKTASDLFFANAGISLTDTFWFVTQEEKDISWKDVNFHDNGFCPVFARWFLETEERFEFQDQKTPDFTTDGIMDKFWFVSCGIPYLAKMDLKYHNVLCANELVYAQIAAETGCKTTPYFFGKSTENFFCACPSFVRDSQTDYISAMQVKHSGSRPAEEKLLSYFQKKLPFSKEIGQMVTLDCVLHNTDRHEKNFGFLKQGTNIQFAPLYDNGFCLGAGLQNAAPGTVTDADMKLFPGKREEFLRYFGTPLSLDKTVCMEILSDVYQKYRIAEIYLKQAKLELETGFEIAEKAGKIKEPMLEEPIFENDRDI